MSEHESRLITWLRFPLIAGVVFIHTDLRVVRPDLNEFPCFAECMSIFVDFICSATVPLFFFIAGYLAFFSDKRRTYFRQLRQKIRTLLVPYVLWIGVTIGIIAICQAMSPGFRLLLHKAVGDCSVSDFLWMFWDTSRATGIETDQHGPLLGQFWFLQSLMVMIVLAPLIRLLAKQLPVITLTALFIIYAWGLVPHYPGIHAGAFFYYTLGVTVACHRPHFIPILQRWGWAALPIFLILYIGKHHLLPSLPDALWAVETFLMAVAELWLASRWLTAHQRKAEAENNMRATPLIRTAWLASSSFFLFASHRYFTALLTNLARNGHLPLDTSAKAITIYVLGTVAVIMICLLLYAAMQRFLPRMTALLTGGRQSSQRF